MLQQRRQEEKENIRKYMEMVSQREAKAEEERLRKKAAADAAFKAVVEQTEKQNNEEDELRMLRWRPKFLLYSVSRTSLSSQSFHKPQSFWRFGSRLCFQRFKGCFADSLISRDMLWEEELEAKRIQDDEDRKRKVTLLTYSSR